MLYCLLGILSEIFLFYKFAVNAKEIKDKKALLFAGFLCCYVLAKILFPLSVYFNLICIFGFYGVMKILYKDLSNITDIFLFSFVSLLLVILSVATFYLINDFYVSMIANRISIIIIAFATKNIAKPYKNIIKCWNRNRENPNKIKSLTLRNICVITLNIMIFVINLSLQIAIASGTKVLR